MRFEYGQLAPFCSVEKRGLGKRELSLLVSEACHMSRWSCQLTERKEWSSSPIFEKVEFAIMTPRQFGFESMPMTRVLLNPKRLAEWSHSHLRMQTLELCQPDDAYYIRVAYRDQPEGELLQIAMSPLLFDEGIDEKTGRPWKSYAIFHIEHYLGLVSLRARLAMSDTCQDLDSNWVFRLKPLPG